MQSVIVERADFLYYADLSPVQAPADLHTLSISSQWRRAKDPDYLRSVTKIFLDRQGLLRLRELVDAALAGEEQVA